MSGSARASVDDVAAAVLSQVGEVTTWKLQKLVYYAQAWCLVRNGRSLFDDEIEAWREGPVVRSLYEQHRGRSRVAAWPKGNPAKLDKVDSAVIAWVVRKYGAFSAENLSRMSHAEVPWFIAREMASASSPSSNVIDPVVMSAFYARQEESPDAAVSLSVANASLEGHELGADWEALMRDVAEGDLDADDLVAREIRRVRG